MSDAAATTGRAAIAVERPEVVARIPTDRDVVIEASAGTGKTFALEHLVVELLLTTPATIDQILVVTFTERAAAEVRARMRQKLRLLAEAGPELDRPDLPPERVWVLDGAARARLRAALHGFEAATIATIHSFCQRVLTEHAFAGRRLLRQEAVDGREAFGSAFRAAVREELAIRPELVACLRTVLEAGGGLGELEELLWKAAGERGCLRPGWDPARLAAAIEAFPVAEVCAADLATTLRAGGLSGPVLGAVGRRLAALGEQVAAWQRATASPGRASSAGEIVRFLAALQDLDLGYLPERLRPVAAGRGPAASIAAATLQLVAASPSPLAAAVQTLLPPVRERLERHKRAEGLFDFDDMLSLVRDAVIGPDGELLRRTLRERYRYALIDEFQDTDAVQWELFRTVFLDSGGTSRLIVVGDPKQAIYGFRGADVNAYLDARAAIAAGGGGRVSLDRNFRSTPPLLEAVNRILAQDDDPPFFQGPDIRYPEPVRPGGTATRAVDATGGDATPVCLLDMGAPRPGRDVLGELGARIAAEIRALLEPRQAKLVLEIGGRRAPLQARDVFVLTHSGPEGKVMGRALREAGIPHSFYKQEGLFACDEAAHVRDLLFAIDDPHDPVRRMRAWLTPFFGLGLEQARRCRDVEADHPLLARLLGWHASAEAHTWSRLFARILDESGLIRRELLLADSERELTNYLHLFELLTEEAVRSRPTPRELAFRLDAWISGSDRPIGQDSDIQRLESERAAVQIMTMHKAKGLEAAVVFVAGGFGAHGGRRVLHRLHEEGQRCLWIGEKSKLPRPVIEAAEAEREAEDERLLYVALTRAKARLYLPYFPAPEGGDREVVRGPYRRVNQRLRALVPRLDEPALARAFAVNPGSPTPTPTPAATGADDGSDAGSGADGCTGGGDGSRAGGSAAAAFAGPGLAQWHPSARLLDDPDDGPRFELLRERARGFAVTSYTALRARADRELDADDFADDGGRGPQLELSPDELPPGAHTGVFLHELLEVVPLSPLGARPALTEWHARPEIAALFRDAARAHGVAPRHVPHAQTLVHAALTTPVRLGARTLAGLAAARHHAREMEFLYPAPGASPAAAPTFVKGFVDLLFEHEELTYLVDWKSDLLPSWDPRELAQHVDHEYALQARIYAVALIKLLGIGSAAAYRDRFGGVLYCFVRGMAAGGAGTGVVFRRPEWDEVCRWGDGLPGRTP